MAEQEENPDAALLAAIDEWKEAWREVRSLDDEAPGLDGAAQKAIRLERKIARMPAMTAEGGCQTKVEVIRKAEFEDEVLLGIMFLMGRDAERLGIADAPLDLRADWCSCGRKGDHLVLSGRASS
jgi:hypothetical protein